jgi:septal ring factor EnvC (AmiA/AmiB activator)
MKKVQLLLAFALVSLALVLVVQRPSPGAVPAQHIATVATSAESPQVPVAAKKQPLTSSAPASNAEDQAIKALVDLNRDLAAQYLKIKIDAQRNRDQWKQRWNEDTEKLKAELAESALKVQDAEREAAASEARLKQTLAAARAEVEREKREQAAQAAAAATAPPPTPPPQGASNF